MEETHHTPALAYDDADEYRPEPPPPPEKPLWQDGSIRYGIHTSIAGDITESLEIARRLGANCLQIFSLSPRMWPRPGVVRLNPAEAQRFRERRAALRLGPLVIHDNYLINLATADRVLRVRSIQAFHDELVRAAALGADFLVTHPGSAGGHDPRQAALLVAQGLRQAARGLKLGGLRILLENTAGQGSVLGARFAELKTILDACPELPLGVCVDTAHLLATGYDVRSAAGLARTLEEIERTVGLARVFVVHVNDSKVPLGARVDRHAHLGRGHIGLQAFRRILNHPLLAGKAFVLETPVDKPGDDLRNVRALAKLLGVALPRAVRGARDGFLRPRRRPAGPKAKATRGKRRPAPRRKRA
jgi:deoxyribonuclease-4